MTTTPPRNENLTSGSTRRHLLGAGALMGTLGLLTACTTPPGGSTAGGGGGGGGQEGTADFTAAVKKLVNGRTLQVGFTPPVLSEYYTQMENAAFTRMAQLEQLYGVNWKWEKSSPTGNFSAVEQQISTVQTWTSRKFDIVFICTGANFATMQGVYKTAMDAGTKIFQFNQPVELYPVEQINTVSNIGYDNRWQSGYVAGKFIADTLKGKGKIVQIMGPAGSDWTKARLIGFNQAMTENPGIEVVGSADGGYLRDKGLSAAQDLLTRHPDINAIYGENEDMALGASQAVDAAGLKQWDGSQGIVIVGADGLLSGMDAIRNGKLTASVDVNSVDNGTKMIDTAFQSVVLGNYVPKISNITTHLVTKDNVETYSAYINGIMSPPKKY
ncbi:sugar ABC transporter substrate-binding protein [Pseudarthrobacter sp. HLT3-5]|uniref:sugar ABC transporter substrate-binding protein n=1 Tax=Pseudarthrobacter cellobiosi TaxID=2953654 RepID=UPI00208E444B|nr:sugar ABC transporter substrate-binding protein [Pseudarthrobacter sp. HLT3-5]MCO4273311.1 sugar ABC transporter substrate-binding protein [Pseudarthrobacter sp. HLT3-5]